MGVSASHRALAARRSPWDEPIERVKRPPEAVKLLNTLPAFPLSSRSLSGQKFCKKPCFASQNYRFILNLVVRWLRVAAGGWLEGPEKTIDLGKKQPRGLAKRDHQNG